MAEFFGSVCDIDLSGLQISSVAEFEGIDVSLGRLDLSGNRVFVDQLLGFSVKSIDLADSHVNDAAIRGLLVRLTPEKTVVERQPQGDPSAKNLHSYLPHRTYEISESVHSKLSVEQSASDILLKSAMDSEQPKTEPERSNSRLSGNSVCSDIAEVVDQPLVLETQENDELRHIRDQIENNYQIYQKHKLLSSITNLDLSTNPIFDLYQLGLLVALLPNCEVLKLQHVSFNDTESFIANHHIKELNISASKVDQKGV